MLDKIMICIGWATTGYFCGVIIAHYFAKLMIYLGRKYGNSINKTITRAQAIARIYEINALAIEGDYLGINNVTYEQDYNIKDFVDATSYIGNVNKWTDRMLEDLMDCPFYRYSMFDNYHIGEED